jgi:hypothetical protein
MAIPTTNFIPQAYILQVYEELAYIMGTRGCIVGQVSSTSVMLMPVVFAPRAGNICEAHRLMTKRTLAKFMATVLAVKLCLLEK